MLAVLAEAVVVAQLVGDEARLIQLALAAVEADHLLQRDHVGVQLAEHGRDPSGPHAPVQPLTLVHVVGDEGAGILLGWRAEFTRDARVADTRGEEG